MCAHCRVAHPWEGCPEEVLAGGKTLLVLAARTSSAWVGLFASLMLHPESKEGQGRASDAASIGSIESITREFVTRLLSYASLSGEQIGSKELLVAI